MNREQQIIKTSIIGIIANIFLAGFKAAVGLLSNSVAVVLDAVNNLSDALSSLITIIGTKLAGKQPDKKHPLGYGRIEYLSATIIAVIVLYAGITSLVESIKKIVHPETPEYGTVALIIIAVAVVVKILLGTYVKKVGKDVDSDALVASGSDAQFDSIISASTLVAAFVYLFTKVSLEAWLGAVIAIVIIKSGFEMLRDTISEILGERMDPEVAHKVKETINAFPEVEGTYDLIVHNYGPERTIGSVHIEVPDTMTVEELDHLEREIIKEVYLQTQISMTGISVYSKNTRDPEVAAMLTNVREVISNHPEVLQMHGFYVNTQAKTMQFDIIVDFSAKDRVAVCKQVKEEVQKRYPDYHLIVTLDADISD